MTDQTCIFIYVGLCAIFGGLWMLGAICKSHRACRPGDSMTDESFIEH